jgi:electron transfer flavoprotein alpha subunit
MGVLLVADHDGSTLAESTSRALSAATKMGGDVHLLVAGSGINAVAQQAGTLLGVAKVLCAEDPSLAGQLAEPVAVLVTRLAEDYDAVVAPATSFGKNVMPRVAALLDVMQISDVIAVHGADTFDRTIYAGNAIQTVRSKDRKRVLTVRPSAFSPVASGGTASIEAVNVEPVAALSTFRGAEVVKNDRPDLTGAKIVVSGGRGLGSQEKFKELVLPLADKLGAAVGASRAAVDSGFAPNDWQVGQTGKVVAPDLYVALGISGAIQHLAGMKDSKIIAAINKDGDAPIFQVADYGLVGDIFELVPQLSAELDKS